MDIRKCDVCGKSFRGIDPLVDDKGRAFHQKCARKPDLKKMAKDIKKLFDQDIKKE